MSAHLSGCDQCGGPINGEQYCGDCMAYAAARIVSLDAQLQQAQANYGGLDHDVDMSKAENVRLRGMLRERLPENVPSILLEDLNDYWDEWYTRVRAVLAWEPPL